MENWKKRSEWLEKEEGKEFLKSFPAYESMEDFYRELSQVGKVNYQSAETSMEDAVEHSRKVLTVILKARNITSEMNKEQQNVSDALKAVGCVPWKEADEKFQDRSSVGELLYKENVSFPLTAYTQLVDASENTFSFGLSKLLDGDERYSWISEWLSTQEMAAQERAKASQPNE